MPHAPMHPKYMRLVEYREAQADRPTVQTTTQANAVSPLILAEEGKATDGAWLKLKNPATVASDERLATRP